jgi:hypothetical protein
VGITTIPILKNRISIAPFYINIFFLVVITQLLSWFLIAPDPRFIYGFLLCGVLALITAFNGKVINLLWEKSRSVFLVCISLAILVFTSIKIYKENHNWIFPFELPQPPLENIIVDNIKIHVPGKIMNNWNPRCYGTDLPCAYKIDSALHARGSKIADGFKIKK